MALACVATADAVPVQDPDLVAGVARQQHLDRAVDLGNHPGCTHDEDLLGDLRVRCVWSFPHLSPIKILEFPGQAPETRFGYLQWAWAAVKSFPRPPVFIW